MGLGRSVLAKGAGMSAGIGTLGAGAAVAAVGGGGEAGRGWKVERGFMAVRTSFGRVKEDKEGRPMPEIVGQGIHPFIPGSHALKRVSVQDRISNLGTFSVKRDQQLTTVSAEITWHVSRFGFNPYKALFNAKEGELEQLVVGICRGGLRSIMSTIDMDRIRHPETDEGKVITDLELARREQVVEYTAFTRLDILCREKLAHYGSELLGLSLGEDAPDPSEVGAQALRDTLLVRPIPATNGNGFHANGNGHPVDATILQ